MCGDLGMDERYEEEIRSIEDTAVAQKRRATCTGPHACCDLV